MKSVFSFDYDLLVFRVYPSVYVCIRPGPVCHVVPLRFSLCFILCLDLFPPCVLCSVFCFLFYFVVSASCVFHLHFLSLSCFPPLIVCTSPHVFHLCSIAPAFPVDISLSASVCSGHLCLVLSFVLVIPLQHLQLSCFPQCDLCFSV